MTDRGKPRKAQCLAKGKTRPGEIEQVSLPRYGGKALSEEKHNGTRKELELKECEQRKPNHTKKTSVQSMENEATTKHFAEEINILQRTPNDNPKAPVQRTKVKIMDKTEQSVEETTKMEPVYTTKDSPNSTKAKKCGGKTKSPEKFSGEMQPETPKDTAKASLKTTKAKTCGDNPKSPLESARKTTTTQSQTQETTNDSIRNTKEKTYNGKSKSPKQPASEIEPETQKNTKKTSIGSTKAKMCAGKVRSPEKFTEQSVNIQPETPKYTKTICVMQDRCKDNPAVDTILYTTLEKLKIRRNDRANAAEVINDIKKYIFKHLKENTQSFKDVEEPLCTGSYYENVKVSQFSPLRSVCSVHH